MNAGILKNSKNLIEVEDSNLDSDLENHPSHAADGESIVDRGYFLNEVYYNDGINVYDYNEYFTFVKELPNEILVNIFSKLCLRDLCNIERVCKQWFNLAQIVWHSKRRLVLDSHNVFGCLIKPTKASKNLNFHLFQHLIKQRLNGFNLVYLDLAELRLSCKEEFAEFLDVICENCPNLINISLNNFNLSLWNFPNRSFVQFVNACSNLKEINLSYSYFLKDSSLEYLFEHCVHLENVNISFCFLITGKCFLNATHNRLKTLKIDSCSNIEEKYLLSLISNNPNIVHLSMNHKSCSGNLVAYIVNNLKSLETLALTGTGFDLIKSEELERMEFHLFKSLHTLDLSGSKNCNKIVSKLLQKCSSLKSLDISACKELNDDMFKISSFAAPLEELNMSFLNISDASLELIAPLEKTLKKLHIWSCEKLTNEGVLNAVVNFKSLTYLNASTTPIDNSVLEKALESGRKIYLSCSRTNIDAREFLRKFKNTRREIHSGNVNVYECKNLKFEVFVSIYTKNFSNSGEVLIVNNEV